VVAIKICSFAAVNMMSEALYKYLLQNKSLSIPGLGTIFVERVPAQSDFVNRQLLPPSFHYRFDKYFDAPDKDFFGFLSQQKNIADYEAIRWYNEWAYDLRNQIRTDNPVTLEKVGVLSKDLSGEIQFEALMPIESYLAPVPAIRVIRSHAKHVLRVGDKEVSSEFSSEGQEESSTVEKESWWIYALVLAAIVLIILFFHFYKNGLTGDATGNRQSIGLLNIVEISPSL
jgi:hypothetical protein